MKKLITTLGALAFAGSLSFAEDKPPGPPHGGKDGPPGGRPNPEEAFKKLDANNDGSISLDEFKAGPMAQHDKDPAHVEVVFKQIDKDGDGKVTLEEFKAHRPPHHDGPGGGGPGGPGNGKPGGPGHGDKPGGKPPGPQ